MLFSLYRSVWMIKCLSLFLVPSYNSNTPLYPKSVMSQRTCLDPLLFHCFHFRLSFYSIKELGNMSFAHKVMGPQSRGNPNFGDFGIKWHLGAGPVAKHKIYYKGERGGFPQVRAMVSLVTTKFFGFCN